MRKFFGRRAAGALCKNLEGRRATESGQKERLVIGCVVGRSWRCAVCTCLVVACGFYVYSLSFTTMRLINGVCVVIVLRLCRDFLCLYGCDMSQSVEIGEA